MKNIHVLPTDKPSSIGYDGVKNLHFVNDFIDDYQNIYITSDEEIKEGDWVYNNKENIVEQITSKTQLIFVLEENKENQTFKKIILTTDQDLIKDGVQAINDKFLEWFVKNPSCESVEMDLLKRGIYDEYKYNIVIPKEEPKQCDICKMYPRLEGTNKCESCYSVIRHFLEQDPEFKGKLLPDLRKKQETLEEAAEKRYPFEDGFQIMDIDISETLQLAFINGAKWQQERSYSEEDMKSAFECAREFDSLDGIVDIDVVVAYKSDTSDLQAKYITFEEWLEQFKKK